MKKIFVSDTLLPVWRQFTRAHASYEGNSQVQQEAGKYLIDDFMTHAENFLKHKKSLNILDMGCGTGTVTKQLADKLMTYKACFTALDFCEAFLDQAETKLADYPVIFKKANFDHPPKPVHQTFDMVFANLSLHWSQHFSKTLHRIYHDYLTKTGKLVFSVPMQGTFSALKHHHYACHAFYTERQIRSFLARTGFKNIRFLTRAWHLTFHSLREALKSIQKTGSHYVPPSERENKPLALSLRKKQLGLLQKTILNYNIGFFIADKFNV